LWRLRARSKLGGPILAAAVAISASWAFELLERTPDFAPGLGIGVLVVGLSAAVVLAFPLAAAGRLPSLAAAALAGAVLLAGPVAYGLDTMATAHGGGDPSAGPAVAGNGSGFAGQGAPGFGGTGLGGPAQGFSGRGFGGPGGSLSQAEVAYLVANRGSATWLVATVSAGSAGEVELATRAPVMAMGGFSGSDPTPTLAELKAYIASGQLRFVTVGGGGPGGSSGVASQRNAWVTSVCTIVDLGTGASSSLYDCQGAAT
jgi:hypothetical protein